MLLSFLSPSFLSLLLLDFLDLDLDRWEDLLALLDFLLDLADLDLLGLDLDLLREESLLLVLLLLPLEPLLLLLLCLPLPFLDDFRRESADDDGRGEAEDDLDLDLDLPLPLFLLFFSSITSLSIASN